MQLDALPILQTVMPVEIVMLFVQMIDDRVASKPSEVRFTTADLAHPEVDDVFEDWAKSS